MEDRETPRLHKYGEGKTTRIMMTAVHHVTSSSGLNKISGRLIFVEQRVHGERQNRQYCGCLLTFVVWIPPEEA